MPDNFEKVTPAERQILMELRTMRPNDRITITADRDGKPETFYIERFTKFILKVQEKIYIK